MQMSDYGLQVDKLNDKLVGTFGVSQLPEPRPLQHGFETISWQDTPLGQAYDVPGLDLHIKLHKRHI